jgi:uncharacterized protein HemY
LQTVWNGLSEAECLTAEIALAAAHQWLLLDGSNDATALEWLSGQWVRPSGKVSQDPHDTHALDESLAEQWVAIARLIAQQPGDAPPLAPLEAACMAHPDRKPLLLLTGWVCFRMGLWGKSQQLMERLQRSSPATSLYGIEALNGLALLAEHDGRLDDAHRAWRTAGLARLGVVRRS